MDDRQQKGTRRQVVAGVGVGVGTVGALAVAASLLPGVRDALPGAASTPDLSKRNTDGGYRTSEHVLRYYQTTRI